jgi:hypothetical protein
MLLGEGDTGSVLSTRPPSVHILFPLKTTA